MSAFKRDIKSSSSFQIGYFFRNSYLIIVRTSTFCLKPVKALKQKVFLQFPEVNVMHGQTSHTWQHYGNRTLSLCALFFGGEFGVSSILFSQNKHTKTTHTFFIYNLSVYNHVYINTNILHISTWIFQTHLCFIPLHPFLTFSENNINAKTPKITPKEPPSRSFGIQGFYTHDNEHDNGCISYLKWWCSIAGFIFEGYTNQVLATSQPPNELGAKKRSAKVPGRKRWVFFRVPATGVWARSMTSSHCGGGKEGVVLLMVQKSGKLTSWG